MGFDFARGRDLDEVRVALKLLKVRRAEIPHAGTEASDDLEDDVLDRSLDFDFRLDSFRDKFTFRASLSSFGSNGPRFPWSWP